MDARAYNAKVHGIPEQAEANTDLQAFISYWLAMELQLQEDIVPSLTRVYRLGAPNNQKRQGPQDIFITFLSMRDKIKLISEARKRGLLTYKGERIEIFQDLPSEMIALCRELRPIMHQLSYANRRYKWIGPAKLQVIHNGTPFIANNMETGIALLNLFGIAMPADYPRKNVKRKLDVSNTHPKGSKIPMRAQS